MSSKFLSFVLCRCTKEHNHQGRHEAQHGNLDNHKFAAIQEEFDLGDRKCASHSEYAILCEGCEIYQVLSILC